ncbi:MAG: sterol-binding protein [Sedimenticola sp.]|nr:MAG: sterol-binding protein [Sedimenticola sp.]
MSIKDLAYAGIETAFNRYLALDPAARSAIARMHGRVIAIEVVGFGQTLYLIPDPQQLQILSSYEGEPDCTIRGTPLALSRLSDQKASSDQLFSGEVEIRGNTELAHQFGKILGAMDIDWEEQLSRYSGDIIAHEVGNLLRGMQRWGRESLNTLGLDLQEYLQEELRVLPVKPELDDFTDAVDTLRDDSERLQARIERLRQTLNDVEASR